MNFYIAQSSKGTPEVDRSRGCFSESGRELLQFQRLCDTPALTVQSEMRSLIRLARPG